MTSYGTYQLARMAGVSDPDFPRLAGFVESPGATFLHRIADAVDEEFGDYPGPYDVDTIFEIADNAVPAYTHEIWCVYVDLAAWQVDDEAVSDGGSMTERAAASLYVVARNLVIALLDEKVEKCVDCGELIDDENGDNETTLDGERVCPNCADMRYAAGEGDDALTYEGERVFLDPLVGQPGLDDPDTLVNVLTVAGSDVIEYATTVRQARRDYGGQA